MVELYASPYDVKSQASLESLEATLESSLKSLRASLKSSLKSLGQVRSQDTSSLVQVDRLRPNLYVGLTVGDIITLYDVTTAYFGPTSIPHNFIEHILVMMSPRLHNKISTKRAIPLF